MYYYGKRGLQRDLNRAVKYYQMGADKGDPEGLYNLGVSLLRVRNNQTKTRFSVLISKRKTNVMLSLFQHVIVSFSFVTEYFFKSKALKRSELIFVFLFKGPWCGTERN